MRVLLIEDEPTTAKALELMLTTEGFNVYQTDLGEEGLDLGKLYDYDIILLDLNLPDMHGYDVLKKLRVAKVQTPVLILSGVAEMDSKIRRYLMTKVITSALTGVLVGSILWLFGLEMALLFGFLAFILNFIPSVGSIVATLLPLPMALVQFDSSLAIVGIILIPGALQLAVGNAIEPRLIGEGLDLHPLTILLALIFWGLIWGIVGMLLAAPITAILKIIMARFETTAPIAEVLAGRLPGA